MTAPVGERLLLVTAHRWLETVRLALAARQAGFDIGMLGPSGHPAFELPWITPEGRYASIRPVEAVARTLNRGHFDLVIPVDDLAAIAVFGAFQRGLLSKESAETVVLSLGDPNSFPIRHDRHAATTIVTEAGLPAPASWPVGVETSLDGVLDVARFPAVLKADATFGGQGVAIAADRLAAHAAFAHLSRAESLHTALGRFILDDDPNHLLPSFRRAHYPVTVQSFIPGDPVTITAACWQGRLLGTVSLRVVGTRGPLGPSAIVEQFDHSDLLPAVTALAKGFGISGLCGLDFLLTPSGRCVFLELNPRATPTAHLPAGGRTLLGLLADAMELCKTRPSAQRATTTLRSGPFPLFPQGLGANVEGLATSSLDVDIPFEAPEVVDLCQRWAGRPTPSASTRARRWLASGGRSRRNWTRSA